MLETIAAHLDLIASYAPVWGMALIFVFMAVESSFIPFPSEVVMIPAGFMAARGELGCFSPELALVVAIVCGVAGSLAGAYANYFLALKIGKPFLLKYGKWFFIKKEALERACEVFNKYGSSTTFICRLVPVIRQLISIPAGISRMSLKSFSFFTALGALIWIVVLSLTGWMIGKSTAEMSYVELVNRGKAMTVEHLPLVIGTAVFMVFAYMMVSRLVLKGRGGQK